MKKELKEIFPKWYEKITPEKNYLIMSGDLDSLLSCHYLKQKLGVQVGGFYDFKNLYLNSEIAKGKTPIFVDADIIKGKRFSEIILLLLKILKL